jgi:hypothetical protein
MVVVTGLLKEKKEAAAAFQNVDIIPSMEE